MLRLLILKQTSFMSGLVFRESADDVGSSGVVSSEHVDSKNAKPKTNDERVSSN
jgi:hypothetical protein